MSILYDMRSGELVKSKLFNNDLTIRDATTPTGFVVRIGTTLIFTGNQDILIGAKSIPL